MKSLFLISIFLFSNLSFAGSKAEITKIIGELDIFAHNSSHSISNHKYDSSLTREERNNEILTLKKEILDFGSCIDSRFISVRGNSASTYKIEFLSQANRYTVESIKSMYSEVDNDADIKKALKDLPGNLNKLLFDADNLLVLYSGYREDSQDSYSSDGCAMYKFKIFQKNKQLIELDFNYTD